MSTVLHEIISREDFPEGDMWHYSAYHPEEVILSEGEESNEIYLVIEGIARVNKRVDMEDNKGLQPGFGELGPSDVFGELSLFNKMTRSATVVAQTEVKVARINGDALLLFIDNHPEIGYRFLKEIIINVAAILRKSDERMIRIFSWGLRAHGIDKHL